MAPKVLVILTSHGTLGNTGRPTGWFLPEFAHPYDEFVKAGFEVVVASPAGGTAPLDPKSIEMFQSDASSTAFLAQREALWKQTAKLSDLAGTAAAEFAAVFVPGGHGPMFDLAVDPVSQGVIAALAAAGKVVAAVCHGPAAFVGVTVPNEGRHLLAGRQVTGFTNEEEQIMGLTEAVPFLLEDRLQDVSGGRFVKAAEPWGEKVVVDGNVITGQNPASARGVGEAIVKAVQQQQQA